VCNSGQSAGTSDRYSERLVTTSPPSRIEPIGTVVVFDASDATAATILALVAEAGGGQKLIRCRSDDLRDADVQKYLDGQSPDVVIVDLSAPYHGAFFKAIRDALRKRRIVPTDTDRTLIIAALTEAAAIARTALMTPSPARIIGAAARRGRVQSARARKRTKRT
jgi:hypothetical protein